MENKKLLYFYTDTCPVCRSTAPELDKVSSVLGDVVEIVKINAGKDPEAVRFGIRSVPSFVFLNGEEEADRIVGGVRAEEIESVARRVFSL